MVNVSPDLERIRPIAAKICSRAVPPIMMPLTDFPHFSSAGSSDDRCSDPERSVVNEEEPSPAEIDGARQPIRYKDRSGTRRSHRIAVASDAH